MVVVPLLAALILVQTLDGGERIVLDARLPAHVTTPTRATTCSMRPLGERRGTALITTDEGLRRRFTGQDWVLGRDALAWVGPSTPS